jgi:hypothetical protein
LCLCVFVVESFFMNTLVCPLPLFQRLILLLCEDRRRYLFLRAGIRPSQQDREWLAREIALSPIEPSPQQRLIRVTTSLNPLSDSSLEGFPSNVVGQLHIGDGRLRGRAWGFVRCDGESIEPLQTISLVGAGMHVFRIGDSDIREPYPSFHQNSYGKTRWSRTIGALGGEETWRRLIGLRVAVVGCGRAGSVIAGMLARLGIQHLVLIDPDIIELHNLGEMDIVTDDDLGDLKVEAVAERLRSHRTSIVPLPARVSDPAALSAVKDCDVIFCCADNDAARLMTAVVATLYHKVLIDIGTGIFFEGAVRSMGADVRLILPAQGCLLCRGNLGNYSQAIEDICNPKAAAGLYKDWRRQRAGSLRDLNQMATAVGVQMLQDLVCERIRESIWARVEFDDAGRMRVDYPTVQGSGSQGCALCSKAGLGDEGLIR